MSWSVGGGCLKDVTSSQQTGCQWESPHLAGERGGTGIEWTLSAFSSYLEVDYREIMGKTETLQSRSIKMIM